MACWIRLLWRICLLVPLALDHLALAEDLKPTRWPLFPQKPMVLVWNAPTEDCRPRHNVHLQLDQFQIVASPNEGFTKQNLTMFYKDRLGLYPHYQDGVPINGGLPQMASLVQHQEKMPEGIKKYIRDPSARGLAVIDWEEWRPIWIRNWEAKAIYKSQSEYLVAQKNPSWTQIQIKKAAQQEFELSSRKFMLETLRVAKSLRPNQLWGFYLFPDCYNHDYRHSLENYTGRCPDVERARNDQLKWLWTESTALFPSVYMKSVLRSTSSGRQFVRNRVKEGMRLASVGEGLARPVFVYSRPTYDDELELLTEDMGRSAPLLALLSVSLKKKVLHDLAVRVGVGPGGSHPRCPETSGRGGGEGGDGGAPAVPLTSRCDLNSSRTTLTTLGPRWLLSVTVRMMAGVVFSSSNWILFFFFY